MQTFSRLRSSLAVLFVAGLVVAFAMLPAAALAQYGTYGTSGSDQYGTDNPEDFPKKGVNAGAGGSASDGSSALPLVLGGGVVLTLAAGAGGLALRRRLN